MDTKTFEEIASGLKALQEAVRRHIDDEATLNKEAMRAAVKEVLAEMLPQTAAPEPAAEDQSHQLDSPKPSRGKNIVPARLKEYNSFDLWAAYQLLRAAEAKGHSPGPSAELRAAIKALTETGSGTGDELVPTGMAQQIWDDVHLQTKVERLFGTPINMPTNPFEIPAGLGDVVFYRGSENTATTATDAATAKMTLTAKELVAEVDWSYSLDEAAVLAIMPEVRRVITRNAREYVDKALVNADTTNAATGNINSDDADPADTQYYLLGWDGLRHLFLVDNTSQGVDFSGAPSATNYQAVLSKLGKYYAENPANCAWIMDIDTFLKSLALDEFLTVDKIGNEATLLTGQLARLYGAPVIVSEAVPLTEADGKVSSTAANNTKGQVILVHRDSWRVGYMRQLLIEVDRDIQKRQYVLVASFRIAFQCYGSSSRSSQTHTAGGYNITV